MQGTIYRRTRRDGSPGRWHAVIDLPAGPGGKRRQKTTTHDTRRQAQQWLARTREEMRRGDQPDDTITVADYLSQWLDGKKGLRPSTLVDYRRHVEQLFIPELGHLKLIDLRPRHVEELLQRLQEASAARGRPLNAKTVRRVLATLHSALSTAQKRGLIHRNPADTVELPKASKYRPKVWSTDEADRFLKTTAEETNGLLYQVMLITGMRRGEAVGLQWGDLDLKNRQVQVHRAVTLVDGQLVIGPPKSEAGQRTLFLDETTTDQLTKLERRAVLAHPWTSGGDLNDAFIFGSRGKPPHPAAVSRRFTTLCKRAGVPVIRLHDLRGTSASLGLAAGEPLLQVSKRLGHSSIAVTADVYSQILPEAAKEAASILHNSITSA